MSLLKMTQYALAIALLSSSLPATAYSQSQVPTPSNQLQAQALDTQLPSRFSSIGLNRQQTDRVSQLRRDRRTQVREILNPRQQRQLRDALQRGQSRQEAMASLNLTPNQQSRLDSIRDSYQSDLNNILSPVQLRRLVGMDGDAFNLFDDLF